MSCISALESTTQVELVPDVWTWHSLLNPRRISVNGNWKRHRTTERNSLAFFIHSFIPTSQIQQHKVLPPFTIDTWYHVRLHGNYCFTSRHCYNLPSTLRFPGTKGQKQNKVTWSTECHSDVTFCGDVRFQKNLLAADSPVKFCKFASVEGTDTVPIFRALLMAW